MGRRIALLVTTALPAALGVIAIAGAGSGAASTATAAKAPRTDAAGTIWLCRPGIASNPCDVGPTQTLKTINADGTSSNESGLLPAGFHPKTDCFYVYPTVSPQKTPNADLTIEPSEISVAMNQAAQFSSVCQVWAPMYKQITVAGLNDTAHFAQADATAYASILQGFKDYLKNFNKGRPIIFIGHSQGSAMLIKLLKEQVDPKPKVRRLLVSALLMGGNVTVKNGSDRGGSFQNIPACAKAKQVGCVLAYSSFLTQPPANSLFGFPGQGVSFLSGSTDKDGLHVLCVNPAGFGSGPGTLVPLFMTPGWTTYSKLYTAQCSNAGGGNVLHVTEAPASATDTRPRVTEQLGPTWGLHLVDVNIAEGNLVADARVEANAWWAAADKAKHPKHPKHHVTKHHK